LKFTFYNQHDNLDCGPTCLRMIAKHYGRNYSIQKLRALCFTNRGSTTLWNMADAAEKIGLRSLGVMATIEQLRGVQLPCVLHWRQNHYVILYKIGAGSYYIADPAKGVITLHEKEFTTKGIK
jgi:ATP-binding cassette subfamily B protein